MEHLVKTDKYYQSSKEYRENTSVNILLLRLLMYFIQKNIFRFLSRTLYTDDTFNIFYFLSNRHRVYVRPL